MEINQDSLYNVNLHKLVWVVSTLKAKYDFYNLQCLRKYMVYISNICSAVKMHSYISFVVFQTFKKSFKSGEDNLGL